MTREKANALLVPADSVRDNAVFVIDGNRVRRRAVVVGLRGTRAVEVLSGLQEGDRVASPAATGIKDGSRVSVSGP